MKTRDAMLLSVGALLILPAMAQAGLEFYGTIESLPEGKAGTWVIGGRKVEVTAGARLDKDNGPFVVGACVEVEYRGKTVVEMTTEAKSRCQR